MLLLPVTRLYWEEFLLFTKKNAEILMRHNADALGQSATELLKAIRENTVGVYIFDESASSYTEIESMRCKHLVSYPENPLLVVPCRNPVIWSSTPGTPTNLCVEHTICEKSNQLHQGLRDGRIVYLKNGEQGIIYDTYLYNTKGELIGRYNEDNKKLYIFNIGEEG